MQKEITITLAPHLAANPESYADITARELSIERKKITALRIVKRSIDARRDKVKIVLKLLVVIDEPAELPVRQFAYQDVSNKPEVLIIGSGPAGLFAALRLLELGRKPVILERGKDVQARRHDIAKINANEVFNCESNYCFGEGGAGTFSDGKLYTRSKKRGDLQRVLEIFHAHGADDVILYEAHPHIGTNELPKIIKNIRQTILDHGGEIRFQTKVVDLEISAERVKTVITQSGDKIAAPAVILATGHSARDIFELLQIKGIALEAKPFAMGVRAEHPQALIDCLQYHNSTGRGAYLPPAAYSLVSQVDGRGVYSFCMCPGGIIVPAATAEQEIVVNGMSPSTRNLAYANSGIVVEVKLEDIPGVDNDPLAGLKLQKRLEQLAFSQINSGVQAPAQRLTDFVAGRFSQAALPKTSYHPGLVSSSLDQWLPEHFGRRLQKGFVDFDRKMRGYLSAEAIIVGVESRTSSPVRIPRHAETGAHLQIANLYPCGEGAGYAGGIVSSAMDGQRAAEQIVNAKLIV